jgi:hypothetical protein
MRVVVCLVAVSPLSSPALAQETRGSIEGIVRDTSGSVLPGVTVEARSPALVGVSTALTDAQGIYRFPALAPGLYEVTATLAGFGPRKVAGIQLLLGQILKVDLSLAVAGLAETVQVVATSPVIDVRQNAASAVITAEVIDRFPRDATSRACSSRRPAPAARRSRAVSRWTARAVPRITFWSTGLT